MTTELEGKTKKGFSTPGEFSQWAADNDRLMIAGLMPTGPGPLDHDEAVIDGVQERCIEKFGEYGGKRYYEILLMTFPERHKKFFPEFFDEDGNEFS